MSLMRCGNRECTDSFNLRDPHFRISYIKSHVCSDECAIVLYNEFIANGDCSDNLIIEQYIPLSNSYVTNNVTLRAEVAIKLEN